MADWSEQRVTHNIEVRMVSQQNPSQRIGTLEGVVLGDSMLSSAYYTDTRTSGKLKVIDGNWVRGSFLQIVHRIPEQNYSNTIGTYLVSNDSADRVHGAWETTLELQSMLYGLSTDIAVGPWTVQKNAYVLTAMKQMLNGCKRKYVDKSARNKRAGGATVLPTGESYLKRLFTLCEMTNNRLDVDGNGNVVIAPYVLPANKSAKMRLNLTDARGIVHEGSLHRETDWLSMPGRVGVCYRYSESQEYKEKGKTKTRSVEKEIRAYVNATGHASAGTRGYMVTNYIQLSDISPKTQARAQALAKQYMAKDSKEKVEWKLGCQFAPIWEGDVVELNIPDGEKAYRGVRKCLVKNLDIELRHMTMTATLKETASGDEED